MNYHIQTAYVITHGYNLEWVILDDQTKAQDMMKILMQQYWKRNLQCPGCVFLEDYLKNEYGVWKIKQVQYGDYNE